MDIKNALMVKILLTSIITILIVGLLFWQHFHGGVPGHHILQKKELPRISNWWGVLLLPVLTWFLLGRIKKRLDDQGLFTKETNNQSNKIIGLFILGLTFGLLIAFSFINNYKLFIDNVLYIFLLMSLIVPIFYSEFILGFILGMTYTLGAILPTIFILIIAILCFLLYRYIRPILIKVAVYLIALMK
jgi:hypothetical protein